MALSDTINLLKKERGLTNSQLSELSGVPLGTLDKITSGKTTDPKLDTVRALAKALGCTLDDFDDSVDNKCEKVGIGNKLRNLLAIRGRNINELATTTDVSAQTLYSILKRNNTKVDLDILQKISDELSVTLDYFCTNDGNENITPSPPLEDKGIMLYKQLDTEDRAEIRGEMKQMLKADKYKKEKDEMITVFTAAHSKDNKPPRLEQMSKREFEELASHSDVESDDDL